MSNHFDLIIIGGGPAGYHAAEQAARGAMRVLLCEQRAVGGVCLQEGCIPSKALLHTAKLYDYAKGGMAAYGVRAENPVLDYAAAVKRKNKIVMKLTAGIEASLKQAGVAVCKEKALIRGQCAEGFAVIAGGTAYTGKHLLICTGSEAVRPPIRGIENAMTNREILALTEIPASLAVIGGGIIGLEMAGLFCSAGSRVTVYEAADRLCASFDREAAALLQKLFEKKGVVFHLGAAIEDIAELDAEKVLVSVGRKPNVEGFGLETIGLQTERGAIVTDECMRCNIPAVFAAGDVNGRFMLAHTAYREAEVAVNTMLGKTDKMEYAAIPSVIYTNPEAAGIGETLESARQKGMEARETKLSMMYAGRFMAENERGEGFCKLVWNGSRLVGAHLVGNPAGEIIGMLSIALQTEMKQEDIRRLILPHPTVGEIWKEAAFADMR